MSDFSIVDGLSIPRRLLALIESGLWPRTSDEAMRQNLRSLVAKDRIQFFAPGEERMYLLNPPFHTVAKLMKSNKFWSRFAAIEEIAPELSINIGDFGLGSDAPVLLDYRADRSTPAVIHLLWRKPDPNTWVRCADNFDQFADLLGLDSSIGLGH
jgi:hypothetical protein